MAARGVIDRRREALRARLHVLGPLGWARELLGHGSVLSGVMAIQMAAGVLAIPIVTRLVDAEQYGTIVAALLVAQVLAVPAAIGVPAAVGPLFYDGSVGSAAIQRLWPVVPIAATISCGLATVSAPLWSPVFTDEPWSPPLLLGVWMALPLACLACSQSVLLTSRRSGRYGINATVSTVGAQAVGILLLVLVDDRPTVYLTGVLSVTALAAVLSAVGAGVRLRGPWRRDVLGRALRVGLPTVPHLLALQVIAGGDRAVIARVRSLDDVGRYQVAYAVGSVGIAVFGAFTQALGPMIHAASDEERWALLSRTSALIHRMAALVTIAVALAAPVAIAALAPESYGRDSLRPIAATIALTAIAYVGYASAVNVLFQQQRSGFLAFATPAAAIGNVVGNILVIPRHGLLGAAFVTIATYIFLAAATWWAAERLVRVPWGWTAIGSSWVAAGAAVTFGALAPFDGWWIAARVVVAVGALGLAARPLARVLDTKAAAAR